MQINAEKSPFLTERLKIWMLPTLALIKNEKVEDYVVGLDAVGGKDDFETQTLADVLARYEIIDHDFPAARPPGEAASDACAHVAFCQESMSLTFCTIHRSSRANKEHSQRGFPKDRVG